MNKRKIALILLLLTLLVVVPVYAQEATEAAAATEQSNLPEAQPVAGVANDTPTEGQAPGLTAGILLIGLGAVGAVGAISLLRDGARTRAGK